MAKKKTETLQVDDSTPVFESSVITKEEFTKTIDNLYLTKLDQAKFNEAYENAMVTSNEHYRNELSLQLALSRLNHDLLLTKLLAERARLFSLYFSNLVWFKRLFRHNIIECYIRALSDADSSLGKDLEDSEKLIKDNEAMIDNFLSSAKLPEHNESKEVDKEDLPEEVKEQLKDIPNGEDLVFEEVTI